MDIPVNADVWANPSKKNNYEKKLERTKQKAADGWKKIKAEKKTIKMIPAVITKNPPGARHSTKDFVVRPKKPQQPQVQVKGKVIVTKKTYVSKKKVSHPKLQKLLRGKHGK